MGQQVTSTCFAFGNASGPGCKRARHRHSPGVINYHGMRPFVAESIQGSTPACHGCIGRLEQDI